MTPTVGRIVHFYTTDKDRQSNGCDVGPYPAVITNVWSHTCVNLKVLPDCAEPFDSTSVCLDDTDCSSWWTWPPRVG